MVAQSSLLAMGPLHPISVAVRTGIEPGSRPWTARSVRVPLTHLSRSMRSMHQRGLSIESVRFDYTDKNTVAVKEAPAKPEGKASTTRNGKTADKTEDTPNAPEKAVKKASRRRKR